MTNKILNHYSIIIYNIRSKQAMEWALMYQSFHFFEPLDIEDMKTNTLSKTRYIFQKSKTL